MTAPRPAYVPKCPVCIRGGWMSGDSLIEHMKGHTQRALAQELLRVLRREYSLKRELHPGAYTDPTESPPPPPLPCADKEVFASEYLATQALLSAWAKSPVDPRRHERRVYLCGGARGCGNWHVTSQEKRDA